MKNHYPAIDILASISRLMNEIVDEDQKNLVGEMKRLMSLYQENQDLITIGAYKNGSNPDLDYAIGKINKINSFLQQKVSERFTVEETISIMEEILA